MQQRPKTWFRSLAAENWRCNPALLCLLADSRLKPQLSLVSPHVRSLTAHSQPSLLTHRRPVESCGAVNVLTRSITHHKSVQMLLARHIGRYKARIAAQTASKTSWAAPEAPSWLRRVEHWLRPPAPSGDPLQLLPWELTSPAALEVDSSDNNDLLAYAGVVVRRNAVCRDAVAACRESGGARERGDAPGGRRGRRRGRRLGWLPLRRRVAARAVRLDLPAPRRRAGVAAVRFARLGAIWPHVRTALGEDAVLRRRGLVVGLPGASDQKYHADAPRVPPEVWAEHEAT